MTDAAAGGAGLSARISELLQRMDATGDPRLAAVDLLIERMGKTDPPLAGAIRCCAIPRRFDSEIVGVVRGATGTGDEAENGRILHRLAGLSFVRPHRAGGYVYHDSVRDALIADWRGDERRELFAEVSERLVGHFQRQYERAAETEEAWASAAAIVRGASERRSAQIAALIEAEALTPMVEAVYHRALVSGWQGLEQFETLFQPCEARGRLSLCDSLLTAASEFLERDAQGAAEERAGWLRWLRYWRARLDVVLGREQAAEEALRDLLAETRARAESSAPASDVRLHLWTLSELGSIASRQYRLRDALVLLPEELRLAERTGADRWNRPVTHSRLASLYWTLGNHEAAAREYLATITAAEAIGNQAMAVSGLLDLAGLLQDAGDWSEAWNTAMQGLIVAREHLLDDRRLQRSVAESVMFLVHRRDPRLLDTLRAESQELLSALGSPLLELDSELEYVNLLRQSDQLDRAVEALPALVAHGTSIAGAGGRERQAGIALQAAWIRADQGELSQAGELYSQVLADVEQGTGNPWLEIAARYGRADVAADQGRWADSVADLRVGMRRSAAIHHELLTIEGRVALASGYRKRGLLRAAAGALRQAQGALASPRSTSAGDYHEVTADVRRAEGRFSEAERAYREACAVATAHGVHTGAARLLSQLAATTAAQGRWRDSADQTEQAAAARRQSAEMAEYRPTEETRQADADAASAVRSLVVRPELDEETLGRARDLLRSAARQAPSNFWHLLNLAFTYHRLGQPAEAAGALANSLSRSPAWIRCPALGKLLVELTVEHVRRLLAEGPCSSAIRYLEQSRERFQPLVDADVCLWLDIALAEALLTAGEDERAREACEAVLARSGEDASLQAAAHIRLAIVAPTSLDARLAHLRRAREADTSALDRDCAALVLARDRRERLGSDLRLLAAVPAAIPEREAAMVLAGRATSGGLDDPPGSEELPYSSRLSAGPIVLEVDEDLFAQGGDTAPLIPIVEKGMPDTVGHVAQETGVRLPSIVIRPSREQRAGAYVVKLREVTVARGQVAPERLFCPDAAAYRAAGGRGGWPAADPRGRGQGLWAESGETPAGLETWNAYEFMLRHVERAARAHLAAFVGMDEADDLLAARTQHGDALPEWLAGEGGRRRFRHVVRGLLDEGVPVTDVDGIARAGASMPSDGNLQPVIERVRRAMGAGLPGVEPFRQVLELGPAQESALARLVQDAGGRRTLVLPAVEAARLVERLAELVGGRDVGDLVLQVRRPDLRPFVRRLARGRYPELPVVTQAELAAARGEPEVR